MDSRSVGNSVGSFSLSLQSLDLKAMKACLSKRLVGTEYCDKDSSSIPIVTKFDCIFLFLFRCYLLRVTNDWILFFVFLMNLFFFMQRIFNHR